LTESNRDVPLKHEAPGRTAYVRGLAFVVGAASLGAEISAARLLAPYFGASTIIWANTIATVLVALSVGYAVGGRLALMLWRSASVPVGLRLLSCRGDDVAVGQEVSLGFTSEAPVGAALGSRLNGADTLWIGLSQNQDARRPNRWQVRHFAVTTTAVTQLSMEWVGGDKGQERGPGRIMLLWQPERGLGPDGRVYLFSNGSYSSQAPWSCHYVTMRIADRTVNGGWLTRRYYDEWTTSRSAPGVCWFRGDVAFAARWMGDAPAYKNDDMFVGFSGLGIESEPMGDFNDIGFIRDVGMRHSVPWVTQ